MENYKEKCEQYLERAKKEIKECGDNQGRINMIKRIFPELKESEDERLRKATIEFVRQNNSFNCTLGISKEQVIAWLEKQGEQKTEIEYVYPKFRIGDVIEPIKPNGNYPPVRVLSIGKKTKSYCCESDDHKHYSSIPIRCENEYKLVEQQPSWSEEDEEKFNYIVEVLGEDSLLVNWLKSLKDRVQPQPKQEWNEKDKANLDNIIWLCENCEKGIENTWLPSQAREIKELIKSLKPKHWKPSEEQLEALWDIIPHIPNSEKDIDTITELSALYEELKKL